MFTLRRVLFTLLLVSSFQSLVQKVKVSVHNLVLRAGFFGILLCASVSKPIRLSFTDCVVLRVLTFHFSFFFQIPNPLFDLAGITCGHFLVPFWTFFGATLIGKAIIKMHIQVTSFIDP